MTKARNISEATVLVWDHSMFFSFAQRLAREAKKVLYHSPWETGFSVPNDCVIGDGFGPEVERCDHPWQVMDKVDLVCFPDCQDGWLQVFLEKYGKRVWGSRNGSRLENDREFLKQWSKENGLATAPYRIITGIQNLRDYLRGTSNKWVKVSKWRGMGETWQWCNRNVSEANLDRLQHEYSGIADYLSFMVEDHIESQLEMGMDCVCIDGRWPKTIIHGPEIKDKSYLACVMPYAELPEGMRQINDHIAEYFKEQEYRNFFSHECRLRGKEWILSDPCCRHPTPAGECELELIKNLGDIVWNGAVGDFVEPEYAAKFAAQGMITHRDDCKDWRGLVIPEEAEQWVKLYRPVQTKRSIQIVPKFPFFDQVGSVVGIGDTMEGAIEALKGHVDEIADNPIDVDVESLYDALKEMKAAEKQGIHVADSAIPKPESALEG